MKYFKFDTDRGMAVMMQLQWMYQIVADGDQIWLATSDQDLPDRPGNITEAEFLDAVARCVHDGSYLEESAGGDS